MKYTIKITMNSGREYMMFLIKKEQAESLENLPAHIEWIDIQDGGAKKKVNVRNIEAIEITQNDS